MARFLLLKNPQFLGIMLIIAFFLSAFGMIKRVQGEKVLGETSIAAGRGCTPIKEISGTTTPGFDCREGGGATIMLTACLPEGCPLEGATVEFEKSLAECSGREWTGCEGACEASTSKETLAIPAGQRCVFQTFSCHPPKSCGSCRVEIDGYGLQRWQKFGCPALSATPKPTKNPSLEPTVTTILTPTSTPVPTATATPLPTATNTPDSTTSGAPEPTSIPPVQVLGVGEIVVLPKTGFEGEPWLKAGFLGVALSIISLLI